MKSFIPQSSILPIAVLASSSISCLFQGNGISSSIVVDAAVTNDASKLQLQRPQTQEQSETFLSASASTSSSIWRNLQQDLDLNETSTVTEEEDPDHEDGEMHDHDDEEEENGTLDTDHVDGEDHDHDHGHEEDHSDHDHDDHFGHDHDHDDTSAFLRSSTEKDSKPWGDVIVAALVINIVTLVGVFFLSGEFLVKHYLKKDLDNSAYYTTFTNNVIPSFACGALLATTVFLVLPEGLYLISSYFEEEEDHSDHDDHAGHAHFRLLEEEGHEGHDHADGGAVWRFGACILGGFLLPMFTAMFFPHGEQLLEEDTEVAKAIQEEAAVTKEVDDVVDKTNHVGEDLESERERSAAEDSDSKVTDGSEASELVVTSNGEVLQRSINWSLASSIMAGDFFHNFADGIFVGTAFLLCDRDLAITISAVTIYHEIAQEIADYFMLTRFCNIPPCKALCINFINGLSVLFGAIVIVGVEDMTNLAIGSILAVSGGVYIYISVAECLPRAKESHKTLRDRLVSFAAFIIGVIPIGLVLLNHGHCEAEHEDH